MRRRRRHHHHRRYIGKRPLRDIVRTGLLFLVAVVLTLGAVYLALRNDR